MSGKATDRGVIRDHIERIEAEAVIPPRSNRKNPPDWDKSLYKQRNKIKRFSGKLKHFRRFATRNDRRTLSLLPERGVFYCSRLASLPSQGQALPALGYSARGSTGAASARVYTTWVG